MITELYGSGHAMLQVLEEQLLMTRNMHDLQVPPLKRDVKPPVNIAIPFHRLDGQFHVFSATNHLHARRLTAA